VITERDAESTRSRQDCEDREMKPIEPEMPQIEWDRGQGQNESADQKRAGRPINAIDRDPKNHAEECRRRSSSAGIS